jgi:hypothetical protein
VLFNFALEYAIRKVKENQNGLHSNDTHQLPVFVDNVYMVGGSLRAIKEEAGALIVASKEIELEVNAD